MFSNIWESIKAFFNRSETILAARLTSIVGLVMGAVGFMDWSPLLSFNFHTGFDSVQVMWLGGITFVKGLIDELLRRYRTMTAASGSLLPVK